METEERFFTSAEGEAVEEAVEGVESSSLQLKEKKELREREVVLIACQDLLASSLNLLARYSEETESKLQQQQSVRIVYPDGHIASLSRTCSVYELLRGNPEYYVCGSFPHTLANRLAADELLQKGTTYFVCATPDARPFQAKKSANRPARKILPRLSRREMRSPTHQSKVFDVHSAAMQQQLESMRGERPPKHLHQLKLVFVRHCLQALRLPRMDQFPDEPASFSNVVTPAPATPVDVLPIFKSAARSELGLYVSRRQEFYLRRARRRRKVVWKPVLQSISEMAPVVEFYLPAQQQDESESSASPPAPPPRKNISPPRQPMIAAAATPKIISPPRQQQPGVATYSVVAPHQKRQRPRGNSRSLYTA